jgi:hypothetical protein
MTGDRIATAITVIEGIRTSLDQHDTECCKRVSGIVLSEFDHERLRIAELWAIPVLASDSVPDGRVRVLCERFGILMPSFETFEDVEAHWASHTPAWGEVT